MKILVKNIRPNPFRKIKSYPINRENVEGLKIKIKKTSFWDNLMARPHPKKEGIYQIAYGHHRLAALRELKIKEIDIPIRNLDNNTMIIMMADENLKQDTSLAIMNETVYAVKDYLDKELAKYKTWEDIKKSKSHLINLLDVKRPQEYAPLKKNGVGQTTILKFLNGGKKKGVWKQYMIQDALKIKEEDVKEIVDKKAVEVFDKHYTAKQFRKAVKDYHVPKAKQKDLAKKIKKEKIGGREIPKAVRKSIKKKPVNDPALDKLEKTFDAIDKYADTLRHKISGFRMQMEDLNVTQINGAKAFITLTSLMQLRKEIDDLLNINQTQQIEGNVK